MLGLFAPALVRGLGLSASGEASAAARAVARRASSGAAASTSGRLPVSIPEHQVEDDLPAIKARVRQQGGSNYCHKLRKAGRTPGQLFSLPGGERVMIDMAANEAAAHIRRYGRNGIQANVMRLELEDAESGAPLGAVRVLPKSVHVNSATMALENVAFMFCPPERRVTARVPIALWNEELAPGVRKGGWLHLVNRSVRLSFAAGAAVAPRVELDMRGMRGRDVVRFADLPLPPGAALRVKDASQPVVRCALKMGGGD